MHIYPRYFSKTPSFPRTKPCLSLINLHGKLNCELVNRSKSQEERPKLLKVHKTFYSAFCSMVDRDQINSTRAQSFGSNKKKKRKEKVSWNWKRKDQRAKELTLQNKDQQQYYQQLCHESMTFRCSQFSAKSHYHQQPKLHPIAPGRNIRISNFVHIHAQCVDIRQIIFRRLNFSKGDYQLRTFLNQYSSCFRQIF